MDLAQVTTASHTKETNTGNTNTGGTDTGSTKQELLDYVDELKTKVTELEYEKA